jgi:hypothetical protein
MPRFMLFVYTAGGEPTLEHVEAMNRYNEELARAGALLALDGLLPPPDGARLTFAGGGRPSITDGPFTEAKEFVGGYWIIQARTQSEAVEWASRAPVGEGTIEVRRIAEPDDFPPEVAAAAAMSQAAAERAPRPARPARARRGGALRVRAGRPDDPQRQRAGSAPGPRGEHPTAAHLDCACGAEGPRQVAGLAGRWRRL